MNPVYPDAKSFLAYYRGDRDWDEGVEFSHLGEDLPTFFQRCVHTITYELLIVYSCTPMDMKEVLRIE